MKCLFLFALIALMSINSRAQFSKGENLLGGNFYISNNSGSPILYGPSTFVENSKAFEIAATPQLIYFFSNNNAVGLLGGFHHYKNEQGFGQKYVVNGFDLGGFFKHYSFFYKSLGLAYQAGINYAQSKEEGQGAKYKISLSSIQISPNIVYRFTKHFSMEYVFGKAGVGRSVLKDINNNLKMEKTDFFVGFFNGLNVSAYYVFSKKNKEQ
jgi:hypothetical protein